MFIFQTAIQNFHTKTLENETMTDPTIYNLDEKHKQFYININKNYIYILTGFCLLIITTIEKLKFLLSIENFWLLFLRVLDY